jgi:hypothetical protein
MYPKVNHKANSKSGLRIKLIGSILAAGIFVGYLMNPLDLFVPRSAKFEWALFREVRQGQTITEVVAMLGEPVQVGEAQAHTGCPKCKFQVFQGNPPWWLVSYREAWVITDENGVVTQVIENSEP